jgi:hypothetical protein
LPFLKSSSLSSFKSVLYPYALSPLLLNSIQWLWALLVDERVNKMQLLGVVSIEPIHVPLLLLILNNGEDRGLTDSIKGLLTALGACIITGAKRWDGSDVLPYFVKTLSKWVRGIEKTFQIIVSSFK